MSELKSWEEMSVLEQYACQYWDMYKDAYGCRPRGIDTTSWTEQEFEKEFEFLGRMIEREELARKEAEAQAIIQFEDKVTNLMHTGTNRARVVAWLMDSVDANNDSEYACYLFGLPYGYFKEVA